MLTDEFEKKFWFFYLDIEEEFLDISKVIPIDEINSETFSFKYIRLLQAICSELDMLFKRFSSFKEDSISINNINEYEDFISKFFPNFKYSSVTCYKSYHNYEKIKPFSDWVSNRPLKWWTINNKLKHNRDEEENGVEKYKYANQYMVLNALAGLFILEMYFYEEIIKQNCPENKLRVPLPQSEIFHLDDWGEYYNKIIANKYFLELRNDGNLCLTSHDR